MSGLALVAAFYLRTKCDPATVRQMLLSGTASRLGSKTPPEAFAATMNWTMHGGSARSVVGVLPPPLLRHPEQRSRECPKNDLLPSGRMGLSRFTGCLKAAISGEGNNVSDNYTWNGFGMVHHSVTIKPNFTGIGFVFDGLDLYTFSNMDDTEGDRILLHLATPGAEESWPITYSQDWCGKSASPAAAEPKT
jgi:hypothetical protein